MEVRYKRVTNTIALNSQQLILISFEIYTKLTDKFSGTAIGTVISLVTSGLIASHPSLGWEGIFYLHGGLSLIWCVLWVVCVSDTPQKHPFISDTEKEFIISDQASRSARKDVRKE